MKNLPLKLLCLLALPMTGWAQSIFVYPATVTAPRGVYQSCTAIVTGVNNKTVTWSTTGGTLVGINPSVVNEPATIALHTTTAGTYTVTATSNTGSVTGTCVMTITASPTPTTGNPRLLITTSMLAALQAKATGGNTIYQGIRANAIAYFNTFNNAPYSWSWNCAPGTGTGCASGTGLPATSAVGAGPEVSTYYFALMALIAPTDPTYNWKAYAHDVAMYYMPAFVSGGIPGGANEWGDQAPEMALAPDWLLGSGAVTSSADKAVLRNFLAYMAQLVMTYGGHQDPTGAYNDSAMFNTGSIYDLGGFRYYGGGNYNQARLLYMAAAGTTFDDNTTDDPARTNTCGATRYKVCPDFTSGSLRAMFNYLDGAMLYDYWAHIEDPNVAWQAYQAAYPGTLPTQPKCESTDTLLYPCFGDGRGGESSEGNYYGYSIYRTRYALNMLHTAGMDDPILYGPQISATTSSWWDMKLNSDLSLLTGFQPQSGVVGAGYGFVNYGDILVYNKTVIDQATEAAMLTFDSYTGRTDRSNGLKWISYNSAAGGPLGTTGGCTSYCGFNYALGNNNFSGITQPMDYFISLPAADPVGGTLPTDPRPSLPLDLYNGSFNQHLMVRNNWTPNANTLMSFYCSNTFINHEHQQCGRFDIFSNGEYITKGRAEFTDYNDVMSTAISSNELAIVNSTSTACLPSPYCPNWAPLTLGGQMQYGYQVGLVALKHSELPAYVATIADTTGNYNAEIYPGYTDVTAASRSMVYLRGTNQMAFYDRAAVGHAASTQTLYQVTTGTPTVAGATASWLTRSSTQKAYFKTLLPAGATLASLGLPCLECTAKQPQDWEVAAILDVTPAGSPTSSQFLSVMEWGASSLTQSTTTLVQSSSGQGFDGSRIGSSVVMFMRSPASFTGTTYPASSGTAQYVADLVPNTFYAIAGTGAPASATSDTAGVLSFAAAGTGNITVGAGVAPTGTVIRGGIAIGVMQ